MTPDQLDGLAAVQRAFGGEGGDSLPQQQVVLACNIDRSGATQRLWAGVVLLLLTLGAAVAQVLLPPQF